MSSPVTSSRESVGGGAEGDTSLPAKEYAEKENQCLRQGDAVVIEASNLFARTVLGMENPEQICKFLQDLDAEETETQAKEEEPIQNQETLERNALTVSFGCTTAAVGGISVLGVMKKIFEIALPFSGLVGAIAGLVIGVALAVICYQSNGFGRARPIAEMKLQIQNHRAVRLEAKIHQIGRQKTLRKEFPEELGQLSRTENAFTSTVKKYKKAYS